MKEITAAAAAFSTTDFISSSYSDISSGSRVNDTTACVALWSAAPLRNPSPLNHIETAHFYDAPDSAPHPTWVSNGKFSKLKRKQTKYSNPTNKDIESEEIGPPSSSIGQNLSTSFSSLSALTEAAAIAQIGGSSMGSICLESEEHRYDSRSDATSIETVDDSSVRTVPSPRVSNSFRSPSRTIDRKLQIDTADDVISCTAVDSLCSDGFSDIEAFNAVSIESPTKKLKN